jgi:subtilisin-like proprotein convertase family protein
MATIYQSVVASGCAGMGSAESQVEVHIKHPRRGDLTIMLQAPNSSLWVLKYPSNSDNVANVDVVYLIDLSATPRNGTWYLLVRDSVRKNTGYLDNWTIRL